MSKRLKLGDDKMLCGVCSGLAEYFDIEPVFIRLTFICGIIAAPILATLYLLLAIIMPS